MPTYRGPNLEPRKLKMLSEPKLVVGEPLGMCIVDKDPSPGMILQSYFDKMAIRKEMIAERPTQIVGEVIRVYPDDHNNLVVDCYVNCEYLEMCLSGNPNEKYVSYVGVIW
jgi:hypothetical protein